MTAAREAIGLPLLFLTVALLSGLRPGAPLTLAAPPLFSLVLGSIAIAAIVRSGALAVNRLMHGGRGALSNLNGLVVLLTLFFASAQTFAMMTPESGLPRAAFVIFFFVLLLNTHAASPDRARLLRSVMVILASAFILKFVVLAALSDPAQGRLARVLQILFEGVTLGAVTQAPLPPAAGYLAFFTLVLYLVGVSLLPAVRRAEWPQGAIVRSAITDERRIVK